MRTIRLTMGQAMVEFLKRQYVSRDGAEHRLIRGVFGIFGHGNVAGLGQALEERGGRELPYFQPKNEQAMVHAAAAYSKTLHRLGAMACTSSVGPGATNMVTGAAGATINRIPVLLLPGDIFANRRPNPVLQQLEFPQSMDVSVNDCFKPVSRYWDRINRPEQILAALPEAMRVLADPAETGAVTLCLPEDVQAEAFDYPAAFFEKRVYAVPRPQPSREALREAARWLRSARRPLIIAGGGVHYSEATEALRAFAERLGIPVACTQAGKGALPDSHPLCIGAVGATGNSAANRLALKADLVLSVGHRYSDFTTASKTQFQEPGVRFININLNAFDARKHGALPIAADAKATLESLGRALQGHKIPRAYAAEIRAAKEDWERRYAAIVKPPAGARMSQAEVISVLNEALDENSILVHAAGGLPGDLHKLWRSKAPGDYHSEYGYSCMGYEIAGALGIKMARPDREVYAAVGDGSYLMLNHEIATAVQEGLKITIVLLDNHGYQCIHNLQRHTAGPGFGNEFRHREAATGRLTGPTLALDFVSNAASLGAATWSAKDRDSLAHALREAREQPRTALIHVPVDPDRFVPGFSWWDVPVAEVSRPASVRRSRADYVAKAKRQRFYY